MSLITEKEKRVFSYLINNLDRLSEKEIKKLEQKKQKEKDLKQYEKDILTACKKELRYKFNAGFEELVKVCKPHTIIVYGSANYPCFEALKRKGVNVLAFESKTAATLESTPPLKAHNTLPLPIFSLNEAIVFFA